MKRIYLSICIYSLTAGFLNCFFFNHPVQAKDKTVQITSLKELVSSPKKFMNKKLTIEGKFHSFSSLSLDYPKAMKSSKEFIGIILSRPDQEEIPLVELKISAPVEMFKSENISIAHGDKLQLNSKVYAIALGEPWLEVKDLKILEKAEPEER